jgi:hypothetical protein
MTQAERDLVSALRAELASIAPSRACDRRAEAAGLAGRGRRGLRAGTALARLEIRLADRGAPGPAGPSSAFDWDAAPDHCRWAWLRGVFLTRGSLSLASGRTHLEFVLEPAAAATLASRLAEVGLPANARTRRGHGVVTWKSGDQVGTFLRGIGGGSALLELEVRQVARSMRGDLNRVLNAESANLQRAVAAASRQLAAIEALEGDGRLAAQPPTVRAVAAARRETPEATLAELAARVELTRSRVQRALERIERLAELPAGDGRSDAEDAEDADGAVGARASGMIQRRCVRSSSPRTGRCTPRRAMPARSRP